MNIYKASKKATFAIIVSGIIFIIALPLYFVISMSFMSKNEVMHFPLNLVPRFSYTLKVEKQEKEKPIFYLQSSKGDKYTSLIQSNDIPKIHGFLLNQLSLNVSKEKITNLINEASKGKPVTFSTWKNPLYNYKMFFLVSSGAFAALMTSLKVVFLTVIISLTIGSLAGYALARYVFKGKDFARVSVLFVRMFPAVSIAIPMTLILANMGLFDTPSGLSLVYSVGNIALTIWITSSIFMGIPVELEEASQVFGATKLKTFIKVTLPLALPGLAASSMYCFLGAWNETVTALILTQNNPTFAVVVYNTVFGQQANFGFAAAGGILQAIPAVVFTFIIKKYINQMWGNA
jgi:multiple sugar transport system permease protein